MKKPSVAMLIWLAMLSLLLAPATALGLDMGNKAPLFEGNSTQGKIGLTDYLGKKHVVLALYFAVFTPV